MSRPGAIDACMTRQMAYTGTLAHSGGPGMTPRELMAWRLRARGLSIRQVGLMLGLSRTAARRLLDRGRQRARRQGESATGHSRKTRPGPAGAEKPWKSA